ncbi:MAG TPA: hypothetical protein PK177_14865 [Burkholderiaceae bacterium]|nr:hypothetical protein [Burkholderiaceae bacterium]
MDELIRHGRASLDAFEHAIEKAQDLEHEDLARAVRHLVDLRDALICSRRQGWPFGAQQHLDCVNALMSLASSAEFPMAGVRWRRLCSLRDALKDLIDEFERMLAGLRG